MSIANSLNARVYWPFEGGTSFSDHICYLCFMLIFIMSSCLFLAALWSPAGIGYPLVCGVFMRFVVCHVVSRVRCGAWLYQFLNYTFFIMNNKLFV